MSQENVETVRRVYAGWQQGDFKAPLEVFERNVALVIDDEIPEGGVFVGLDGVRAYTRQFLEPWESLTISAETLTEVGDSVLARATQKGVGRGSGLPTSITYFQAWTFRGGKVIRLETILREPAALEAVGLREEDLKPAE
jgi:ketosteroid isomerase-like protein